MWLNRVSNPGPLALESDVRWGGGLSWADVDWRCRCTKIFLNLEIYYIVPKKLVDFFFSMLCPRKQLYT